MKKKYSYVCFPEQHQYFSDLLVYHLGSRKLKRQNGGVGEGRDSKCVSI